MTHKDKHVWLAQCVCGPNRHVIMAGAFLSGGNPRHLELMQGRLVERIEEFITKDAINPYCGICGSQRDKWTVEVGKTNFTSVDEAMPALVQIESANIMTAAYLKAQNN